MHSKEDIRPISYVRTNAAEMLEQVNETGRPVYITQNGEARAVLLDTICRFGGLAQARSALAKSRASKGSRSSSCSPIPT